MAVLFFALVVVVIVGKSCIVKFSILFHLPSLAVVVLVGSPQNIKKAFCAPVREMVCTHEHTGASFHKP